MRHSKWHFTLLSLMLVALEVSAQPGAAAGARDRDDDGSPGAGRAGESVVFTLAPPARQGVGAKVTASVGKAQSSKIAEDLSVTPVETEGKLELVARNAVIAELFHRDEASASPATGFAERGVGRSDGGAASGSATWNYEIVIDEFNEIRLADGTRSAGVHATLRVMDEEEKLQYTQTYYDPPQNEWRSPEQVSAQIAKLIDRAKTDAMMSGVADSMLGVFGADIQKQGKAAMEESIMKKLNLAAKLKANLASNAANVNIHDYQFQEAAVRNAVSTLMQKAPAPGQLPAIEVRNRLMPMRKDRDAYNGGLAHFNSNNLDEAIALWSAAKEEPAQHRNLGIAKLRKAADIARKHPDEAATLLTQAEDHLGKAKLTPKRDDALLTAPASFRRAIAANASPVQTAAPTPQPTVPPLSTPPTGRHALLVGVGTFAEKEGNGWKLNELPAAPKDVALLKKTLVGLGFPSDNIVTLVDKDATQGNIEQAIFEIGRKVQPDDLFVFSIATHGLPPDVTNARGAEGFAYCYDSSLERVRDTTFPFWLLTALLNNDIPCRRKIVLQDTCHAGAQYQGNPVFKMKIPEYAPYFALLAACGESQTAAEKVGGNGLFTRAVVDFWSKPKGGKTVGDLASFVQKEVPKAAQRLGHTQTPVAFLGPGADSVPVR